MSDTPVGDGWWQASDDLWYPPEEKSDFRPPPPASSQPITPPATPAAPTSPGDATSPPVAALPAPPAVVVPAAPEAEPAAPHDEGSNRTKLLIGGGIAALAVIAIVAFAVLSGGESADDKYLAALNDADLNDWSTDRAAINAGFTVCEGLDGGAPARGSEVDLIAVEQLCNDYLADFRVLENKTVAGTFAVYDDDWDRSDSGRPCSPDGGYGDINSSTRAVVTTPGGDELTRAQLGRGEVDLLGGCSYEFELDLIEGEDLYILEVGDRGEISYAWEDLQEDGAIAISLGDPFDG
ncbi:DUF732 domain-containing protein [Ilumatobacter sp.]|uniref:DUF732 domain-containing protein n=1 Tax=Ilumatobacter sp. TaxID=1967498 RepID=UPI0037506C7D